MPHGLPAPGEYLLTQKVYPPSQKRQPEKPSGRRKAMARIARVSLLASAALLALGTHLLAQQNAMTFFVTSVGIGKGADLGGLEGADRHCQSLAQAVGAGGKTWRAYLS